MHKVVSELPAAVGSDHSPHIGQRIEEVGRPEAREDLGVRAGGGGVAGSLRQHLRCVLGNGIVETD